jgi:catechol 2,3-dioxygenase-like lactoylglutathione lyase family enzyme
MRPKTLDHVALWVADRDRIAAFCCAHLGMHVIAQEDAFTLVGSDARHGKLTLFDAEGARERGALRRVGLRVSDLAAARARLPEGAGEELDLGEGLRVRLVEAPTEVEYDLDHCALYAADPEAAAAEYLELGFGDAEPGEGGVPRVEVGGAYVELHAAERGARVGGEPERPLLNHLAVLVDSAQEHIDEAEERGIVESVVDAANTIAVFVWGPDRVRVEYVEHKPTFSLV